MDNSAIVIIDVPEHVAPDEAAQLLNAPGESYFLVQVLPIAGGHRAYLRRYKQTPAKAELTKEHVNEATAMSILRANRDKPVRTIVSLLEKDGINVSKRWVCEQLDATCAEDGREEEALAYVKKHIQQWAADPSDIVGCLRQFHKIKRSIGWARRKIEELSATVPRDNS